LELRLAAAGVILACLTLALGLVTRTRGLIAAGFVAIPLASLLVWLVILATGGR
jgi:hypothetical protein